ncbi:unnamed protein product [Schistosoma mattheei]|uniref:Uncharacterized protein n=1 Tax=Schistosoma mattheei TaxID=31246 RepID=A0A183PXJ5_9TREM|nr:unnamed protein product [Schistosoma mattheei]
MYYPAFQAYMKGELFRFVTVDLQVDFLEHLIEFYAFLYPNLSNMLIYISSAIYYFLQALQEARESLHRLYLFQESIKPLLKRPPPTHFPEMISSIVDDPEMTVLLSSPWSNTTFHGNSSLLIPSPPTAITGSLEVRCLGCQDIVDHFPAEIVNNELSGTSTSRVHSVPSVMTSRTSENHWVDVRCSLLIDHKRVWDSPWRQPNQQCWDSKTTFNIDRGKELEVQVYWKRTFLPSSVTTPSGSSASSKSGSYVRLEELLGGESRSVMLPMLPMGKVFLVLKFSDPLLSKPRCGLHRQKRLFSKRKGNNIPRINELDMNIPLWTRLLKSGQLSKMSRSVVSGSWTLNHSKEFGSSGSVMMHGLEGRFQQLNTSLSGSPVSAQVNFTIILFIHGLNILMILITQFRKNEEHINRPNQ